MCPVGILAGVRVRYTPSLLPLPRQKNIQLIRKRLAVAVVQRRRAAGDHAAVAQFVEQVAHGQAALDVVLGVELAPGVQGVGVLFDDLGGQRDVRGDDQVAGLDELHDGRVHHVEALAHADGGNELRLGDVQGLVGHQGEPDVPAHGGAEEDFLDGVRQRVGIGIDVHGLPRADGDSSGAPGARTPLPPLHRPLPLFPRSPSRPRCVIQKGLKGPKKLRPVNRSQPDEGSVMHPEGT